jgi:putative endonuclease
MKRFTSRSQITGELGESLACRYLLSKNFKILERNFSCPFGEIDIIATQRNILYFFEVKSSLYYTRGEGYVTGENLTKGKITKCLRTIFEYFLTHESKPFQLDALLVEIDSINKRASIQRLENISTH